MKLNLKNLKIKQDPYKICKDPKLNGQEFDYAIIGGGSGGVASANKADQLGLKTVVFDFVEPSPKGTKWGLGGTCVNVGCVPKKLMHNAAILSEQIKLSREYGFEIPKDVVKFNWKTMVKNIQLHIKKTNFDMASGLSTDNTQYVNCMTAFKGPNEIIYSPDAQQIYDFLNTGEILDNSKVGIIKAKNTLISVGGRPVPYPAFKYSDLNELNYLADKQKVMNNLDATSSMFLKHSITSDDLFSLEEPPKKALIIGSGYIGLECAGFLSKLGCETTLLARSKILRAFDSDITEKITDYVNDKSNIDLMQGFEVDYIEELKNEEKIEFPHLRVHFKTSKGESTDIFKDYDTIILATGRYAKTNTLGLNNIGIEPCEWTGKIKPVEEYTENTGVDGIYVVGDALYGAPELTPTAIKSGINVANQVYNKLNPNSDKAKVYKHNYKFTPTTIFSYPEYSTCGYSETEAIELYGEDNVNVYHSITTPLEENMKHNDEDKIKSYFKLVCTGENDQVVGMHYLGLNAGEIMQGFGTAIKLGCTKEDLDLTVGIHPTIAEDFTTIIYNKKDNDNPEKTSC